VTHPLFKKGFNNVYLLAMIIGTNFFFKFEISDVESLASTSQYGINIKNADGFLELV
jgi:hypothetical protein